MRGAWTENDDRENGRNFFEPIARPPGDPQATMYAACWAALALATVAAPDDNSTIIFRSNFTEPHWVA